MFFLFANSQNKSDANGEYINVESFLLDGKPIPSSREERRGPGAPENPTYPLFLAKGGLKTNAFTLPNESGKFNLMLEEASVKQNPNIIKKFKVGTKLQFGNDKTIYEIGKIITLEQNIKNPNQAVIKAETLFVSAAINLLKDKELQKYNIMYDRVLDCIDSNQSELYMMIKESLIFEECHEIVCNFFEMIYELISED